MTPSYPPYPTVERRGDELVLRLGGYADADGHVGSAEADWGDGAPRFTLYRDGALAAERTSSVVGIDVDPTPGRYRAELNVRAPSLRLSTRRDITLEFTPAHADPDLTLPFTAIGFAPSLDLTNTAETHRTMQIPITLTSQGAASEVRTVGVEVSYDDGATWQKTPVSRHSGAWRTRVKNPARPGYVSLRGHVVNAGRGPRGVATRNAAGTGRPALCRPLGP
ncbi:hypothetical protein [Nonomuraea aridisoli]|uniref:hypothetical protein n=1 Tax=Nonomuraea aridisoli TaxID=2070368 RepID=UPI000DA85148|nr:hypothetical protein [Nonomuraea aridisoli]